MVKSDNVYSPQAYLELVTGECYLVISGQNDVEFIENALKHHGFELWNYPLSEIDHIVENKLDVVLVECVVWNGDKLKFDYVYRWFEVEGD